MPKWETGGYGEIVLSDEDNNDVEICYDYEMVTNGVKGHNDYTYSICAVNDGEFSPSQKKVLFDRIKLHLQNLQLTVDDVLGHREFTNQRTLCPGNDMDKFRDELRAYIEDGKMPDDPESKIGTGTDSSSTPPASTTLSNIIRFGDRGERVAVLQRKLLAVGESLPRFRDDGIFGDETRQAVEAFQGKKGIVVDGMVGPETERKLNEELPPYSRLLKNVTPMLRGRDVLAVQRIVGATPDSVYGPKTEEAVKAYQEKHGLKVDGIVGPKTWVHMFGD